MGLLSIFKRTDAKGALSGTSKASTAPAPSGANETGDAVQQARARARRRLTGAVVLLVIGIIGFPLVFETRPRPIPVDIPIEIPKKDGAPALVMPPARPAVAAPVAAAPMPPDEEFITESRADAGREVAPRERAANAAVNVASAAERSVLKPAAKPLANPVADATHKPASAAEAARFVVQVGAFAEAGSAHEARAKVEKLGLKTYTQVAQTPSGSRIRVRAGPFGTRTEADAALAKARAAGLTAVVLTL